MRQREQLAQRGNRETWPPLPIQEWEDTRHTLHMWTQIVGKIQLALAPHINHWWQVPLYVSSCGLTTSALPYGTQSLTLEFNFIDHVLEIRTSSGIEESIKLAPRSVADFYQEVMVRLDEIEMPVQIFTRPVEIAEAVPFEKDYENVSYDQEYVERFWRTLIQVDRVFKQFRGGFIGKASPVQFFWGSFDLAATRFSGRLAPRHPGGIPNVADWVMHEAYSHELSNAGWWPGGHGFDAAFYAYAYPEPEGYRQAAIAPQAAYYHPDLREFFLPYEAVQQAEQPDEMLMEFLQSTYEAAAELGNWDRAALERSS